LNPNTEGIPLLFPHEERYREQHNSAMLIPVHIGQTLNAAAAPFVVASVSHLSLVWFPDSERNTATAIGNVASAAGTWLRGAGVCSFYLVLALF
jgi:hypothetical protein